MINLFRKQNTLNNLDNSRLFDETSFYTSFIKDLHNCKEEIIIESPFITSSRMEVMTPILRKLLDKGVKVHIITRDPIDHDEMIRYQATNEILACIDMGVNVVLLRGNHHRKLAIIDGNVLWEGSLNILSQSYSQEVMRRIADKRVTMEMFHFLQLDKIICYNQSKYGK